ncbi:hypothetical protein [Paenibacillus sp. NPDC057967]
MNLRVYKPQDFENGVALFIDVFNAARWNVEWTYAVASSFLSDLTAQQG